MLFLMAIAPALPWRKAAAETLHRRLVWPAWAGTLTVVACVVSGLRGLGPLLAFGLAAFAGAAALRQLGLSVRAARRSGQPVWRALMGRSNGGMVVHIGVVVLAVGFAASSAYGHRAQFRLTPGQSAHLAGHSLTYLGTSTVDHGNKKTTAAKVRVDGGSVYQPALNQFPFGSQAIGTPSVKTGPLSDVYLTLVVPPDDTGTVVIGVNVQPLIAWLWTGGAIMGFGTFLAAWPGRRRRPAVSGATPDTVPALDPVVPEPAPAPASVSS
jgi:cytochrome c-type biogenesis protein CcmF